VAKDDPALSYELSRAIHRLTQRAVAAVHMIVSKGPLSPLTEMQSVTLRVALAGIVREAVGVGEWLERKRRGSKLPPPLPRTRPKLQTIVVDPAVLDSGNPGWDEDKTTEPIVRRH
jgi:hypothetical protein